MNKAELVAAVAEKAEVTKKDADKLVASVFEVIRESLANGEKVALLGFGNFEVADRKERMGRNPQNNEPMKIPACKVPKFKPGKDLRDAVNK
ncbi:MAG: HU family DNA-binding protein [Peptococcaceae bacterium]|nr:HU family DNA-binding protein [Peptococcaceae bacterium]